MCRKSSPRGLLFGNRLTAVFNQPLNRNHHQQWGTNTIQSISMQCMCFMMRKSVLAQLLHSHLWIISPSPFLCLDYATLLPTQCTSNLGKDFKKQTYVGRYQDACEKHRNQFLIFSSDNRLTKLQASAKKALLLPGD